MRMLVLCRRLRTKDVVEDGEFLVWVVDVGFGLPELFDVDAVTVLPELLDVNDLVVLTEPLYLVAILLEVLVLDVLVVFAMLYPDDALRLSAPKSHNRNR